MNETGKLIEKEGVLGFHKNTNEFEAVTNFMVKVNGYVADEGNVLGYIIDMTIKIKDP